MFPLPFYNLCQNSQQLFRQKTVLRYSWSRITARFKVNVKLSLDKKLYFRFQNNFSFYMRLKLLVKCKLTLKRAKNKNEMQRLLVQSLCSKISLHSFVPLIITGSCDVFRWI